MDYFRIAVTGCGGMANTWVKYALERQDAEIVALVDINEENARAFARRYRLNCGIYREIGEAIRMSGANLVFDVTIPEAHHYVVTTALEMGCHVMGEKPMASSMEEAREMVSAAEICGKMYAVMQNRRYLKHIRAFRELVRSGTIGKPGFVCADFFLGPHFGGFRDIMESPLILDMAIHTFDQARFITGADPVSVYCHEFNPPGSWYKEMQPRCVFSNFPTDLCSVIGAHGVPRSSYFVGIQLEDYGQPGTAVWDGINPPYCEIVDSGDADKLMHDYKRVEALTHGTAGKAMKAA